MLFIYFLLTKTNTAPLPRLLLVQTDSPMRSRRFLSVRKQFNDDDLYDDLPGDCAWSNAAASPSKERKMDFELLTRAGRIPSTSPSDRKFAMEKLRAFSKCRGQKFVKCTFKPVHPRVPRDNRRIAVLTFFLHLTESRSNPSRSLSRHQNEMVVIKDFSDLCIVNFNIISVK